MIRLEIMIDISRSDDQNYDYHCHGCDRNMCFFHCLYPLFQKLCCTLALRFPAIFRQIFCFTLLYTITRKIVVWGQTFCKFLCSFFSTSQISINADCFPFHPLLGNSFSFRYLYIKHTPSTCRLSTQMF